MKPVGKPDAGNPHVRFDERGRETGRCRTAQATAPFLDSTKRPLKGRGSRPSVPAAGKLNFLQKYKALTEGGVRRLQAQAVGRVTAVRVVPVQIIPTDPMEPKSRLKAFCGAMDFKSEEFMPQPRHPASHHSTEELRIVYRALGAELPGHPKRLALIRGSLAGADPQT
jgi:hypothetical protein